MPPDKLHKANGSRQQKVAALVQVPSNRLFNNVYDCAASLLFGSVSDSPVSGLQQMVRLPQSQRKQQHQRDIAPKHELTGTSSFSVLASKPDCMRQAGTPIGRTFFMTLSCSLDEKWTSVSTGSIEDIFKDFSIKLLVGVLQVKRSKTDLLKRPGG